MSLDPPPPPLTRPDPNDIRQSWRELFSDPMLSSGSLRSKALTGLAQGEYGVPNWVPLRSLHWKLYLDILPSPSPPLFATPLSTTRATFDTLRATHLRAPDGSWAADVSVPAGSTLVDGSRRAGGGKPDLKLDSNNPLSLSEENPWTSWYSDLELRKEIRKDVERTFPDIPYFALPRVQTVLTTILFLYSIQHPDIGYRQGMHELAASILLAVDLDSLDSADASDQAGTTLSRAYVEHDSFILYEALMKHAKPWYQWREDTGRTANSQPQVQPIVNVCNRIHSTYLRSLDPTLWSKLEELGIEPQLYGIRWIRLLFTREFSLDVSLTLWDGIFAEDPTLRLVEFICVAMLLRIRNELIHADYSEALSTLLRYPGPSSAIPFSVPLLLSQAILLRDSSSTPQTGVAIVMQNQEALGISANPPPPPPEEEEDPRRRQRRGGPVGRGHAPAPSGSGFGMLTGQAGQRFQQAQMGLAGLGLNELAKGFIDKGKEMGIDKAILARVAEVRRNLPDFPVSSPALRSSVSSSELPTSHSADLTNFTSPPLPSSSDSLDAVPSQNQQQQQHIEQLQTEILLLRKTMLDMSSLMSRCVEGLEKEFLSRFGQDIRGDSNGSGKNVMSLEKSLGGLRAVQDGLKDPTRGFDLKMLMGHEERDSAREVHDQQPLSTDNDSLALSPIPHPPNDSPPSSVSSSRPLPSPQPYTLSTTSPLSPPPRDHLHSAPTPASAAPPSNFPYPSSSESLHPSRNTFSSFPPVSSSYSPFSRLATAQQPVAYAPPPPPAPPKPSSSPKPPPNVPSLPLPSPPTQRQPLAQRISLAISSSSSSSPSLLPSTTINLHNPSSHNHSTTTIPTYTRPQPHQTLPPFLRSTPPDPLLHKSRFNPSSASHPPPTPSGRGHPSTTTTGREAERDGGGGGDPLGAL